MKQENESGFTEAKQKRLIKRCAIAIFCIDVVVGITVVVLLTSHFVSKSDSKQQEGQVGRVDKLRGAERWNDGEQLIKDVKKIFESCLDERRQAMNVKTRTKRATKTGEPGISFISVSKPVVHLQGLKSLSSITNDSSLHVIRNWNNESPSYLILIRNAMKYENGAITIPTLGSYRVYSQVAFSQILGQRSEVNSQLFEHQVLRYNAEKKIVELLLSSNHSECETIRQNPYDEFPSYMSTVVSLNAGDSVFVKASHFRMLMADKNRHYFGVLFVW